MKKVLKSIVWGLIVVLVFSSSGWCFGRKTVVKVGINAPITGDIPKVGEGTKYAARGYREGWRHRG
jgi:branched-chain amino acid transport system substrate-binding protein